MKFKDLVNPGIDTIHPYEPGRSLDEVIQEFNLSKVVKLASNENSLGASKKALEIVQSAQELHYCLLYTSPSPRDATLSRMPSSA